MILSFIIDGVISLYIKNIIPFFIILSIVISSYFKKNDYLSELLVTGILYDVVYTDTIIINALVFYILYIFTIKYNNKMDKSLFNLIILDVILILLYLLILYLIFNVFKVDYTFYSYINILKSISLNILFLIVFYFIDKVFLHTINW